MYHHIVTRSYLKLYIKKVVTCNIRIEQVGEKFSERLRCEVSGRYKNGIFSLIHTVAPN